MGDRVTQDRPEGLADKKPKKREAGDDGFDMPKRRKVRGAGQLGLGAAGQHSQAAAELRSQAEEVAWR